MVAVLAMNGIAKIDAMSDHPAAQLWSQPSTGVLARIQQEISRRGAHPARTLVLLPYAQLLPLAQGLWAQCYAEGFAPRFETTLNWTRALGMHGQESATDITFDVALDTLTAHALLARAGLAAQEEALAGLLAQAAHQLAPMAAARSPATRTAWAQTARVNVALGMDGPALVWEAALARVAVEWAAVSSYRSDWLFAPDIRNGLDCLVVVQGLALDPLAQGLQSVWGDKLATVVLADPLGESIATPASSHIALHACRDGEDEALRAAACTMRRIEAGEYPVALVSSDRLLTRRMRALLEGAGVQIRDENGWKLSTSHSAARVMSLLKASGWNASTDAVLDWLKGAPLFAGVVQDLEAALRRDQVRDWRGAGAAPSVKKSPALMAAAAQVDQMRAQLQGTRTLPQWLGLLRGALQTSGVWDGLQADAAGVNVLTVLRLAEPSSAAWESLLGDALWAARRMDLSEFTAWVNQALEGASFQPAYPAHEQVVILPMNQMLGRPFAAVVLAGCDEVRLNPSPEPPGAWTPAQRAALGLPSRESLAQVMAQAWQHALQTPLCDVLWRTSDDAGEPLLPSALVQLLQLGLSAECASAASTPDPRAERAVASLPVVPPMPTGDLLALRHLSASAYDDLRQCPYRFFALRILGLQSVDELDSEVDKRDFGLWLHAVLKRFHEAFLLQPPAHREVRQALLDEAATACTSAMALAEGEFLPFAAAWPAVRDGYLDWLEKHEATGAAFTQGETAHKQSVVDVQLVGRIDRIDTLADGTTVVVDYKTEPSAKTSARVKDPLEDTQIAFYAALLPHDTLQGAYVNVGERDGTKTYPQPDLVQARDALIEGILHDMRHIGLGAALPALGEGAACDFCHARGLCRKDFWAAP
jgi:ATP-dependent helicase/nuclease subunit B